jgi:hypothetical protein
MSATQGTPPPGESDGQRRANEAALESARRGRTALDDARIAAMQNEQVVFEGAAPKAPVNLFASYVVTTIAMFLPLKVRTAFAFALNFLFNHFWATLRLLAAWVMRAINHVAIAAVYFLVLGPTALWMRLWGRDDLHSPLVGGSYFTDKEPEDETEDRFLRQY